MQLLEMAMANGFAGAGTRQHGVALLGDEERGEVVHERLIDRRASNWKS